MSQNLLSVIILISICSAIHGAKPENDRCHGQIVETVPDGMVFEQQLDLMSTTSCWLEMIRNAKRSIQIASLYWTLLCNDTKNSIPSSCEKGEQVFDGLIQALQSNVTVQIVVNDGAVNSLDQDLRILQAHGAEIVQLNFTKLVGAGVLHTKVIVADEAAYVGSANMDWRALSEVKELGIYVQNCLKFAEDLRKVFGVYWLVGKSGSIPTTWPDYLRTSFNMDSPMSINMSGIPAKVFVSHSPPAMNTKERANDVDAVVKVIDSAKSFIAIQVMEYMPAFVFSGRKFWPVIDNALRRAVYERTAKVRFLAGVWKYTRRNMISSLKSLNQLNITKGGAISIKLMKVPATQEQAKVDHSRVNHCKFIVTDEMMYIGTSNWSADYFVNTGGVGVTIMFGAAGSEQDLRSLLEKIHKRDWQSKYSFNISSTWKS